MVLGFTEGERPFVTRSFWNKNQTAATSLASRRWQGVSVRATAAPKRLSISARQLSFTSRTAATLATLSQQRSVRNLLKSRPRDRKDAVGGQASYRPFRWMRCSNSIPAMESGPSIQLRDDAMRMAAITSGGALLIGKWPLRSRMSSGRRCRTRRDSILSASRRAFCGLILVIRSAATHVWRYL